MPELPEVEAARRALAEHTVGKKIIKVIVADDSKVIDGVSPKDFEAALVGKTIVATHRKGKNMWIELDSPPFPSFQFGMAGAVYIKGVAVTKYKRSVVKDTDEWPSKYSKLFVELADGLEFSFTDKRRFAKVRLLDNPVSVPPISELGPDALTEPMTEDELCNSLKKKNIGIKALLLDQSFLSGIGNWMADEVLYQARIHPLQTASSLSKECCTNLLKCINEVTDFAVKVDADSLRFPTEWLFHFRWGKKPGKVNGKKLDFIKAGGRTTAYVPELQKLSGNQAVKETDKRSKRTSSGKGGGVDESGSEDEPMEPKVAKGRKSSSASKSSKKKSNASVEDSDGDDVPSKRKRGAKKPPAKSKPKGGKNGEVERRQTRGKGASAKRKHEESDDNLSNSSENGVEDEEEDA
ncbi:formamidopyrimidine-DNA glycosylase isoform X2 [Salvia miltiorrhiza]|uniref:formamidopyrimidine-DNA glycosylase isoform X2 n=1 Tax=Salvia miltiorrhiza TaxID=226208 RepID=UPI0025AB6519|nr:formamidopyrimidine-DNA glycosylase isoform X2 [Salvia miltiorrhiza]